MKNVRLKSISLLAILLAFLAGGTTLAQELSADEVLERIEAEAAAAEDARFLLTGHLIDPDGTTINLEVEMEVIPDAEVARAYFIQPDALADNVVVFDGDTVYNYVFLTNQVTLFDADDPDALGGFVSGRETDAGFSLTLDLDTLFGGWEASIEGYEAGVYRLRMQNTEEGAAIDHAFVTVQEGTWVPTEIILMGQEDRTIAELFVENFQKDLGLSPEDVAYIPEDAEVIDERD